MSPEAMVALISLVGGVIAAIFAWLQAARTARIGAEASATAEKIRAESERLKVDSERRRRAFEVATEESKPVESALDTAWNDIQIVKDLLSAAVAGVVISPGVMESAADRLVTGYAQCGAKLPDAARSAWHSAKGTTGSALNAFRGLTAGVDIAGAETQLREIVSLLSDRQAVIANERAKVRAAMTQRTLELL